MKASKQVREDQMKIDANEMAKLKEEWRQNLVTQRAMLIDKAMSVLVDSVFGHKVAIRQSIQTSNRKIKWILIEK